MTPYLAAYAGAAVAMIALDLVWLGLVARRFYQQGIGHLMAPKPNLPVAVLFYLLFAVGIVIFAVSPHTGGSSWATTVMMGALFGFFAYATYDLTNLATLRNWPLGLTLVDIVWGTVVSLASAAAGKFAMDWVA